MTSRGVGLCLLTLAVYFAAIQTRVGWLYVIAASLVAVLLLSWALPFFWTRGLVAQRQVQRAGQEEGPLAEESEAGVTLHLRSGAFPGFFLQVIDLCPIEAPGSQRKSFFCPRVGGEGVTLSYAAACYKRGGYTFPPLTVESLGPFGLFRWAAQVGVPTKARVYPWYLQSHERSATPGTPLPQDPSRKPGTGSEVFGIREYRPGDPLRYIHWRSTARRDRLVVKEFEAERDRTLTVIIDITREYGLGKDTTLEYSVKLAASLARYAFDHGLAFRLLAQGVPKEITSWQQVMEYLTDVQVDPGATPLSGLLERVWPGEAVVVAAPLPTGAQFPRIGNLSRQGRWVSVAFEGFEAEGLWSARWTLPGVVTVPWWKGTPPADAVARVLAALEDARRYPFPHNARQS